MDELKGKLTYGELEIEVDEVKACPPICLDCSHCYVEDGSEFFCDYDDNIPCSVVIQCSRFLKGNPKNNHFLYGDEDPEEVQQDGLESLLDRMANNDGESIFFGFDSNVTPPKQQKRKKPKGFG